MSTNAYALLAAVLTACMAAGCDDQDGSSTADPDGSAGTEHFCVLYSQVATDIGCSPQQDCSKVMTACDSLAVAWLDCVKRDLTQCQCEPDGDLNCEGSFKVSEGPALCIDEYGAVDACFEQ